MIEISEALSSRIQRNFPEHVVLFRYPETPTPKQFILLFREKETTEETAAHVRTLYKYDVVSLNARMDACYRQMERITEDIQQTPYVQLAQGRAVYVQSFSYEESTRISNQLYGIAGSLQVVQRKLKHAKPPQAPITRVVIQVTPKGGRA